MFSQFASARETVVVDILLGSALEDLGQYIVNPSNLFLLAPPLFTYNERGGIMTEPSSFLKDIFVLFDEM